MTYYKKLLLSFYDKIVTFYSSLYDMFTRKEIEVSIGDIMSVRGEIDGVQMIAASRLIDVEAYCQKSDDSFYYQQLLSGKSLYDLSKANQDFKKTIESYRIKGYNGKSHFLLDRDLWLRNGTHRTAMHLYLKIYTAKAYVMNRKYLVFDTLYERYKRDLPSDSFRKIIFKISEISEQLIEDGVSFNAVIPQEKTLLECVSLYQDDIHVKKEICLNLPNDLKLGFGETVLTLEETSKYKLVLFTLDNPQYEIVSGKLESKKMHFLGKQEGVFFSKSCYEGKKLYDCLSPFFV